MPFDCEYRDWMVDLETLATTPDAHILSIGAVDMSNHDNTFYCTVEGTNQNRTTNFGTIKWWLKQSPEAIASATNSNNALELPDMLADLTAFIVEHKLTHPWANGSCFDIIILENAYRQHNMEIPWKFWNVRDVRTITDMAFRITGQKLKPNREGVHHNALDDAIYQSQWVRDIRNVLEP